MKYLLAISILVLCACSQKPTTKSGFRLILGHAALATSSSGGAFINAIDTLSKKETIYELDAENSATISQGSYTLMAVIFAGPESKSGVIKCGSVGGVTLNTPEANVTITLSSAECANSKYTSFILKLKQNTTAKWDADQWDRNSWGH